MKSKIISTLILFLTFISSQAQNGTLYSDVNGDGAINITDITDLVDYVLTEQTTAVVAAENDVSMSKVLRSSAVITGKTDVNGDGCINIADVTTLIDIILNQKKATITAIAKSGASISKTLSSSTLKYGETNVTVSFSAESGYELNTPVVSVVKDGKTIVIEQGINTWIVSNGVVTISHLMANSYPNATIEITCDGKPGGDTIVLIPEVTAQFPGGGDSAMMNFITQNMKYPKYAKDNYIQGRVTAQFVVNKDGSISDINIIKSPDESLSQEAKRIISIMPKWTPAKTNGVTVRSLITIPIMFRL